LLAARSPLRPNLSDANSTISPQPSPRLRPESTQSRWQAATPAGRSHRGKLHGRDERSVGFDSIDDLRRVWWRYTDRNAHRETGQPATCVGGADLLHSEPKTGHDRSIGDRNGDASERSANGRGPCGSVEPDSDLGQRSGERRRSRRRDERELHHRHGSGIGNDDREPHSLAEWQTLFSSITVNEAPASTSLSAVSVNPTTVAGGTSSTGTVTLTAAAPGGGTVVSLADNSTSASTPTSVIVPAGATSATFNVATTTVASNQVATITAAFGSATRSANLTITASGGGGGTVATFLSPTSNAPDSGGDGNGFQSNATNAYADDAAMATDTNSGTGDSTSCTNSRKDRHRFYDFGIAVPPGSTLAGIEVRLDARADSTSGSPRVCVQLSWDGGTTWTTAKVTSTLGTGMRTFTLGGVADTWGRAWSAVDLSNANFRLRVTNVAGSTSRDFFLEWVAVRPHVAGGAQALPAASEPH
jgi:hypothetical protein